MNNRIPAAGNLKHHSLHQILTYLNKEQKTGILTVENKNVTKNIYVEDGNVVFASSNQDEDRFGMLLIKAGKITPTQRDESLKLSKETNKPIGVILIELGYLTPKDLFRELTYQVKEIILGLFLWEEGIFNFKENPPPSEFIKLKIDMESLISEGINRKEIKEREKDSVFIQKVNEFYENIESIGFYEALEINVNASLSEIKSAYLEMAKYYHPDRHRDSADSSIKGKLTILFDFINKAYRTLSNERKRAEYNAVFLKKKQEKVQSNETIKAEEQFKRGVKEFKQGNFWGAADFFRWATKINPQKATYWAYLSLALSKIPRRGKEAEETILNAMELEPYNADYYFHLGTIYLKAGMKQRAIHQFETALTWDPTNIKTREELEKLKNGK